MASRQVSSVQSGFSLSDNSLDLIRIIAAAQVAIYHIWARIQPSDSGGWIIEALKYFPGVPVFFFISGFVIMAAWRRDPDIPRYCVSRAFRILPAYYAVFLFSLVSILVLYSDPVDQNLKQMGLWIIAQIVVLPSWNPDFLREYGNGTVNGSLWTIPVEISFYACAIAIGLWGRDRRRTTRLLISVIAVSLAVNVYAHYFMTPPGEKADFTTKFLTVSPLSFVSWIWMFCIGGLAASWFDTIVRPAVRWFFPILATFLVLSVVGTMWGIPGVLRPFGNNVGLANMIAIAALVFSFAFRYPDLGRKLLGGNDYSYGLYLFHWPVMNLFLELGYSGWYCVVLALVGSAAMAAISWWFAEKPMLRVGKSVRERLRARQPVSPRQQSQMIAP
ncbi:acyltransferase [Bradyrhizobium sp. 199]|uniref:acyltransferase family protein n=1 Tax=Bradyrhizobium sp. 199 TaxID=2782664 RepID=UPI001FF76674|nr:acyltransferase [Bradyrhizobium sp. 199]MCK1362222.1 acyltransferase [Bradyrhizobium sp. 199]